MPKTHARFWWISPRARADPSALQSRLGHTVNNPAVAAENMSAADSRVRDTDMAKQMMEYTKMNVPTQSNQQAPAHPATAPVILKNPCKTQLAAAPFGAAAQSVVKAQKAGGGDALLSL